MFPPRVFPSAFFSPTKLSYYDGIVAVKDVFTGTIGPPYLVDNRTMPGRVSRRAADMFEHRSSYRKDGAHYRS